jgi:integrase
MLEPVNDYKMVFRFLSSKARKSQATKQVYHYALSHFQTFLESTVGSDKKYNIETVLDAINQKDIDVYELLDDFVEYLGNANKNNNKLNAKTIWLYVSGVKSYFEYNDIDILPRRFKQKVTLPPKLKIKEQAIDSEDIRTILLACTSQRVKAFLLVLASSGTRVRESCSIRNSDIDFDKLPTEIHIRAENTKTKQERDIYISDEASDELKKFIASKYGSLDFKSYPDHFLFSKWKTDKVKPHEMYRLFHQHFINLLDKVGMNQRKREQRRRKITLHSFRRFVKSTISDVDRDFSDWFLGHTGSQYWTKKSEQRRQKYIECMKYLTFLDYPTVESVGKDFVSKLAERDQEIQQLKESRVTMEDQLSKMEKELKESRQDWLKAIAGHVVMEGDWDEKKGKFIQGKHSEQRNKK